MDKRKALFLDRDGVINADTGYPHKPEQIEFLPGIFELCRAAKAKGYLLIVVTNQAGIARGYYTDEDFHALMRWMGARFTEEGCAWDAYYYCPHHPDDGCACRKPMPGMLLKAVEEWGVDPASSIMIGDRETDRQAALGAGVESFFLSDGYDLRGFSAKLS